jgi:hypothetical protein
LSIIQWPCVALIIRVKAIFFSRIILKKESKALSEKLTGKTSEEIQKLVNSTYDELFRRCPLI